MTITTDVSRRAEIHAALGDPIRLATVDELMVSDRTPGELCEALRVRSNLIAHHLDILEGVRIVSRSISSGDGRRRYVHLERSVMREVRGDRSAYRGSALFVCTANSARSQLAAALWSEMTGSRAVSAGTHPAPCVHPEAIAAAARVGLDLTRSKPRSVDQVRRRPDLVVSVCDRAHEELGVGATRWHWSLADPVAGGRRRDFEATIDELREWIEAVSITEGSAL